MIRLPEKVKNFVNNRWLVFVVCMWVQSCSGIGYIYGSISPVIKSSMGYNQRQIAVLGVAKDVGDATGFIAGSLCEIAPIWVVLFIGAAQNFLGYGLIWLNVTHTLPQFPLWVLCVCIFVGANGETYFNTGAIVSGVQNFPRSRGPVVGLLAGFAGLSGAIITQIYTMLNLRDESSIVFVVAVGPTIVVLSIMFMVRPVGGYKLARQSDNTSFLVLYGVSLILAAYLLAVIILQDLVNISQTVITVLTIGLVILVVLPVAIPIYSVFFSTNSDEEISLISEDEKEEPNEVENERLLAVESLAIVDVKKKKGPRRGEDFTLMQALVKADFLLTFFALVLALGSGLTVIDNLGQMCQSLGYENHHIFVSMMSIWNFLGRLGGGYFSEIIVRKYAYPRPVAMAAVELAMACSLFYYAMSGPGAIYVVSIVMGLCYGAHWAIMPSTTSELFGLKSFGLLYSFLALACPAGSMILSGVIASGIYDYEAKIQSSNNPLTDGEALTCYGTICYSITCGILAFLCFVAFLLSMIVVYRTKRVYTQLYGNTRA